LARDDAFRRHPPGVSPAGSVRAGPASLERGGGVPMEVILADLGIGMDRCGAVTSTDRQ
jgi:hypothetical protein